MIVYQKPDSPVSIMTPCECGLTIEQIGRKDVPHGLPFWIVDESDIPTDRKTRNAWVLDTESIGQPSGYGAAKE